MEIKKYFNKNNLSTLLAVWISFIFIQSLFYKFSNSIETQNIFSVIALWMSTNFLHSISYLFKIYGGYFIGVVELIASILLLYKKTRIYGAITSIGVLSGAIFFHLFTPLGTIVNGDGGSIFRVAILLWVYSLILIYLHRKELLKFFNK